MPSGSSVSSSDGIGPLISGAASWQKGAMVALAATTSAAGAAAGRDLTWSGRLRAVRKLSRGHHTKHAHRKCAHRLPTSQCYQPSWELNGFLDRLAVRNAMAQLIYSTIASLDGYVEDRTGNFGLGRPGRRGVQLRR